MQLPPLPDIFGNYILRGIDEVLAPLPVSWLPATPGWALVAVLLLALLAYRGWHLWRRWRRNRYRRVAARELQSIVSNTADPAAALGRIAALLKATALQAYPRPEVAPLTGQEWLQWLDGHAPAPVFRDTSRRHLQATLYRPGERIDDTDIELLAEDAARWIETHREAAHA